MPEGYPLTAEQIAEIDNIVRDREAQDMTLKIALNFHANRLAEIRKLENAWWEARRVNFNLDPRKRYRVEIRSGMVAVVEEKEKEPK